MLTSFSSSKLVSCIYFIYLFIFFILLVCLQIPAHPWLSIWKLQAGAFHWSSSKDRKFVTEWEHRKEDFFQGSVTLYPATYAYWITALAFIINRACTCEAVSEMPGIVWGSRFRTMTQTWLIVTLPQRAAQDYSLLSLQIFQSFNKQPSMLPERCSFWKLVFYFGDLSMELQQQTVRINLNETLNERLKYKHS